MEGRKLGNFCNVSATRQHHLDHEGERELAEGDDGEDGERHEAAGVVYGAVQLLLLAVAQLTARDVLPEQTAAAVQLVSVQLHGRPHVRRARLQRGKGVLQSALRLCVRRG